MNAKNRPPAGPKLAIPARAPASFDLSQTLIVLRSHLWIALGLALAVCTLVAWQQMRQPRLYSATAALFFERSERLELGERGEFMMSEVAIQTRLEQLRSPELFSRVLASFSPEERAQLVAPYLVGVANPNREQRLAGIVRSVMFERKPETMLISVRAIHRDAGSAALLANRFAEEAIRYAFDRSSASSDAALVFLQRQAEELRKKAEDAERALQEYRQRFNLVSLEANQNIIVDNLKSLNASATEAAVARLAVEARLEQAETVVRRGEDAAQLASITGFESLAEVGRQLAELHGKRAVLSQRYGRNHPAMQENARAIEAVEKLRGEQVQAAVMSLRDLRGKALAEERQLAEQLAKAEKEALNLDQLGVEYNILRRAVDSHKASYSQILARLNDATVSAQLRGVNLKISELATVPGGPFSPNPRKTLLITTALALAIILGYPFSAEMFFGRIRSAADVEQHLGTEVLGEIAAIRGVKEKDRPFLVKLEHDEAGAEQFRALYSQLALSSKIDPPKTILITSTLPSEGKSFVAANLAECFVAHSRKTLLVDADLRRPTQHRNFSLDNKAGLIRWLEDGGGLEGDLIKNEKLGIVEVLPGLYLLRAGGVSRKATELMEAGRLPALFSALQRQFDVVILDTPPAGVFPDAVGFAKLCHELIYICRFNTASRQAVRDVLQRMRQTELEIPGVVLNAMPVGFAGSYYYKGYSYQQAKHYAKHYRDAKA